jgi:ABC-type spermidine/putrescine transport system permease subunit II
MVNASELLVSDTKSSGLPHHTHIVLEGNIMYKAPPPQPDIDSNTARKPNGCMKFLIFIMILFAGFTSVIATSITVTQLKNGGTLAAKAYGYTASFNISILVAVWMSFILPFILMAMRKRLTIASPNTRTLYYILGCTWILMYIYMLLTMIMPGIIAEFWG